MARGSAASTAPSRFHSASSAAMSGKPVKSAKASSKASKGSKGSAGRRKRKNSSKASSRPSKKAKKQQVVEDPSSQSGDDSSCEMSQDVSDEGSDDLAVETLGGNPQDMEERQPDITCVTCKELHFVEDCVNISGASKRIFRCKQCHAGNNYIVRQFAKEGRSDELADMRKRDPNQLRKMVINVGKAPARPNEVEGDDKKP